MAAHLSNYRCSSNPQQVYGRDPCISSWRPAFRTLISSRLPLSSVGSWQIARRIASHPRSVSPHRRRGSRGVWVNPSKRIVRPIALMHELHQPRVFWVVSLPSTEITGRLYLYALVAVLYSVVWEHACGNKIGMSIVIPVLCQGFAVPGDSYRHELAHQSAEARGHHKGFETEQSSVVKFLVHKSEGLLKVLHREVHVLGSETIGQCCLAIEAAVVRRTRATSRRFRFILWQMLQPISPRKTQCCWSSAQCDSSYYSIPR